VDIIRGRSSLLGAQRLNIPYVTGGGTTQQLDLYYPSSGTGAGSVPFRCLLIIHGGGWQGGDKALPGTSTALAEPKLQGIAIASLNYRLSTTDVWPAQIYDIKAAIRFVRANARELGIEPDRIGVWGQSSGGHLGALLAGTGTGVLTDTGMGNATISEDVRCAVIWHAPSYFPEEDADFALQATPNGRGYNVCSTSSEEAELFGGVGAGINPCSGGGLTKSGEANTRAYIGAASCRRWLIEHGDSDATIPYKNAEGLYDTLAATNGISATWRLAAGKGHSGSAWNSDTTLRAATAAWIAANL